MSLRSIQPLLRRFAQRRRIRERDRFDPSGAAEILHELALSVIGGRHLFAFSRQLNNPNQRESLQRAVLSTNLSPAAWRSITMRLPERADYISSSAMCLRS
jgi:hypothetical protein